MRPTATVRRMVSILNLNGLYTFYYIKDFRSRQEDKPFPISFVSYRSKCNDMFLFRDPSVGKHGRDPLPSM